MFKKFKPELTTLEACHRLALIEGQKENKKRKGEKEMSLKEWVESLKAERERRMKKKTVLERKWKIAIAVCLVSVITVALIIGYVVPTMFGASFVSVSFDISWPNEPKWDYILLKRTIIGGYEKYESYTVWPNGTLTGPGLNSGLSVYIHFENSYLLPVQLRYNGFSDVMLIYNQMVDNPQDIAVNKEYLVWGAFFDWPADPHSLHGSNFDYYVSRMKLSNYSATIQPGKHLYIMWESVNVPGTWCFTDLNNKLVANGTYYVYYIFHGILAEPGGIPVKIIRSD
jgi:hypothetical protein